METKITCPQCGHDFSVEDVFSQFMEKLKAENFFVHAMVERCLFPDTAKQKDRDIPLMYTEVDGKVDLFHVFDVHHKDEEGDTPLHWAAWNKHVEVGVEVLKSLISEGADVNAKGEDGWTPLHRAAAFNKNVDVVKFLISKGADIDAKNNHGGTPLDVAKREGNTAVVEYLSGLTKEALEDREIENMIEMIITPGDDALDQWEWEVENMLEKMTAPPKQGTPTSTHALDQWEIENMLDKMTAPPEQDTPTSRDALDLREIEHMLDKMTAPPEQGTPNE